MTSFDNRDSVDEIIARAESELEKVLQLQEDAKQALAVATAEASKWQKVIAALRPPEPKAKASEKKTYDAISDDKLDEYAAKLREQFQVGVEFLTRDAAAATEVSMSRISKVLQNLRERGDVRLAGRAPGKGIIPLWALTPISDFSLVVKQDEEEGGELVTLGAARSESTTDGSDD